MQNELILYRDPENKEIGAIIELVSKKENKLNLKGSLNGHHVEHFHNSENSTVKKTNNLLNTLY